MTLVKSTAISLMRASIFKFVIIAACLVRGFAGYSQTKLPTIIPPSPNVASLAKYGDIPIGLYTGQPNISFPLYEIKYNDFSMPISLSYNYSGLKVEEYPGWVGTGWTLHATGVITRQTRGLPDERTNGYNGEYKRGKEVVGLIESPNGTEDPRYQSLLDGIVNGGTVDTEPDMFVFTLPGLSGKFFFDEKQCDSNEKEGALFIKYATLVPYQNITVKGYFDYFKQYSDIRGLIKKFEIIDDKGVHYLLQDLEGAPIIDEDSDHSGSAEYFANTWYLSRINTPFNNEINFSYKYRRLDNPETVTERLVIPYDNVSQPQYHSSPVAEAILDKIIHRNGVVEFVESVDERLDWNSASWPNSVAEEQPKALDHIKITERGKLLKEYNFKYGYFGDNARLRLESFQEIAQGVSVPPYKFEYLPGVFPAIGNRKALFNQDHWGYYTGKNISTLLTPFFTMVDVINFPDNANPFSIFSPPDKVAVSGPIPLSVQGNIRIPEPTVAQGGLLSKITYPSGGTSSFEYEPNEFYSETPPNFVQPQGDFVDKAAASASTKCTTSGQINCEYGDEEERVEIKLDHNTFGMIDFSLQTSDAGESTSSVMLVKKKSQTAVFWYRRIQGQPIERVLGPEANEVLMLVPDTYELVVNATLGSSAHVAITRPAKAEATFKALVIDNSARNYVAGGFRIAKVSDCSFNSPCVEKFYSYNDPDYPNRSSGILINVPSYAYETTAIAGGNGGNNFFKAIVLLANSIVPIAGTQGGVIGYKHVKVSYGKDGVGGSTLTHFTSAEEYPDKVFYEYPVPVRIDNDWKRGFEVEKRTFKKTSVQEELVNYHQSSRMPFETYNRTIALKAALVFTLLEGADYPTGLKDYRFKMYALSSGKTLLKADQTTEFSSSGTHSTSSQYFYENTSHLLPTRTETTNSNRDVLTTKIRYTEDVDLVAGLTDSEILGIKSNPNKTAVIEKLQFNNLKQTSQERNIYNGAKLIQNLSASNGNPLEEEFKINDYDIYGNIQSHMDRKGETVSYLYDANHYYPIASVKNADQADIFHTSFEDDGTEYQDAQNNKVSKTGTRIWVSGSFTFPTSFQPTHSDNAMMSYWYWSSADGWRFSGELPYSSSISTSATLLDEIRAYPKGSQMTTYTYQCGVGITTVTDPNNKISYFSYDALGRLKNAKDQDGNLVKNYEYGYKIR